jgi:competence protein ComFC
LAVSRLIEATLTPFGINDMIRHMLTELKSGVLNLVFPLNCLLCRKYIRTTDPSGDVLCQNCLGTLQFNSPPFCLSCSRHLAESSSSLCCHCRTAACHFNKNYSALLYTPALRRLILSFKYGNKTSLKTLFSHLVLSFINQNHLDMKKFDMVIPVPLSSARMRERGYNQAQLLASIIANHFGIPLSANNLLRCRHTPCQAALPPDARLTNVQGAFKINHSEIYRNQTLLVVDDVLTTGATVSEIARLLKSHGAAHVETLTLAIAA